MLRPYRQYLSFCCVLQHVRFYCVERIGCVGKAPWRKVLFKLLQKTVAFDIARKLNRHASLAVWRIRRRRAKFAATQSTQPRQRRPTQLINHSAAFAFGRNTKKAAMPMASTTNTPMSSTLRTLCQPSAAAGSPRPRAPRHARNSFTSRGKRNVAVAIAASSRPQRIAFRMEPASALSCAATD
jgi:L-lactate utilization protein LutC